jgi:hypothetical protein
MKLGRKGFATVMQNLIESGYGAVFRKTATRG